MQIKSSSKMVKYMQCYDKKENLFSWKALFVNIYWFGHFLSIYFDFYEEIYTGSVVARDLQVQIKIAIENSSLSKLPYETIP